MLSNCLQNFTNPQHKFLHMGLTPSPLYTMCKKHPIWYKTASLNWWMDCFGYLWVGWSKEHLMVLIKGFRFCSLSISAVLNVWGRTVPCLGEGVAVTPVPDWFIITVSSSLSPTVLYLVLQSFTINNPHYVALVQDKFHQPVHCSVDCSVGENYGRWSRWSRRSWREMCVGNAIQPPSILRSGLAQLLQMRKRDAISCFYNNYGLCSQLSLKLKTMFQQRKRCKTERRRRGRRGWGMTTH